MLAYLEAKRQSALHQSSNFFILTSLRRLPSKQLGNLKQMTAIRTPTESRDSQPPQPPSEPPQQRIINPQSPMITIISGTLAGTVGTYIKQPLQRLKWLKQVSEASTQCESVSLVEMLINIARNEGVFSGLWRGSVACIMRNVPHALLVYTFFPMYQTKYKQNEYLQSNLPFLRCVAGASASLNATLLTHPLDTLRVRLAAQFQSIQYRNTSDAIRGIVATEHISALYKGLPVTILGTILRGGLGFGMYETLKSDSMRQWNSDSHPLLSRMLYGFISGGVVTTITYPIDTIRRRQQVFGSKRLLTETDVFVLGGNFRQHSDLRRAVQFVFRTEGIHGFFKGLPLGLIKSPIAISVSFTTNDIVKRYFGWKS